MRYLCTGCNYIYDESQWDEDISYGTSFDALDDYFTCPVCWAEKDYFHEIKEEVNYIPEDPREPLEIDHYIETKVSRDKLVVTIGNEIHPMWDSHRISAVSLYDEYGDLIETKFMDYDVDPVVEFDFDDLWEYEIRVQCSLHGVWWKKFSQ